MLNFNLGDSLMGLQEDDCSKTKTMTEQVEIRLIDITLYWVYLNG
jgi:hypothetical protein